MSKVVVKTEIQNKDSKCLDVRAEFPLLSAENVVYLDSAASAQKPRVVIDAVSRFYSDSYANVHRGVYELSERATDLYESSRESVAKYIGANSSREIVFTRGATESINLVCYSWGEQSLRGGDEILITIAEHHSNFVPWQQIAKRKGCVLKVCELDSTGEFSMERFTELLSDKTRLVAVTQLANGLGVVLPVQEIIAQAHDAGAIVLIDGAQSLPHMSVDVTALGCDFFVFSGHKIYGPSGIGALYAREALLETMAPFHYGGDMISSVSVDNTVFNELPYRFEAGTPNIAGSVGLGAALEFLNELPLQELWLREQALVSYAETELRALDGVSVFGPRDKLYALVTFNVDGIHPHDLAQYLGQKGVAIRSGHHCAEPLQRFMGHAASSRASFGIYNNQQDVERLLAGVKAAQKFFLG